MLAQTEYGTDHGGTPLVIAHGLFGSARNWGGIAKRLGSDRHVVTVDLRNHGESGWFDTHRYEDLATDLSQTIISLGGSADLLGHSMGGKAAMTLALTQPDHVRQLIVADIAPVAYTHSQRPYLEAMQTLDLGGLKSRSQADKRLAQTIPDGAIRAFLLQSLDLAEGRWRINLDVLDREMDEVMGFPDLPGSYPGPTLFLSGGASDYVQGAHRDRIRALFPKARFVTLPGAGHWLHAERPDDFEATMRAFLDRSRVTGPADARS